MKKIKTAVIAVLILILVPLQISGADYWTGNGVHYPDKFEEYWEVQAVEIFKETDAGRVYSIENIDMYSAYVTDYEEDIGKDISKAFRWINKSRLGYVKLIKVRPGQEVSFLFSAERYVYCAEFTSDYKLIKTGVWISTGDVFKLQDETEWIMLVFRMPNGSLDNGSGLFQNILVSDIDQLTHKYLLLEPFKYKMVLNDGKYENYSETFVIERLGVEPMTLPAPVKTGYEFMGWISSGGNVYKGDLSPIYVEDLFKDNTFNATWREVKADGISLSESEIVLEQNSEETFKLIPTISPENTLIKSVTWKSSDETIARVDENGIVYPGKTGIATVTATTENGFAATCKVYVMGFEISLPSYCQVNQIYEIKVDIINNGNVNTKGRKSVVLFSEEKIELVRDNDGINRCEVLSEKASEYGGNYVGIGRSESIISTQTSESVFFKLKPSTGNNKAGDYEGNITFTVSVE